MKHSLKAILAAVSPSCEATNAQDNLFSNHFIAKQPTARPSPGSLPALPRMPA
jgi:hypothetical protein